MATVDQRRLIQLYATLARLSVALDRQAALMRSSKVMLDDADRRLHPWRYPAQKVPGLHKK